ncbi:hypothetical protein EXN66_Car013267 [Channa argus]|uniref:Uncharacterized protein n=1 Tax=Channa argus TaxID=215402 RepID=A0A6G1Q508_CHAAH|nr:hypothetical protein EXN66_Car013267 [Channa argus]
MESVLAEDLTELSRHHSAVRSSVTNSEIGLKQRKSLLTLLNVLRILFSTE